MRNYGYTYRGGPLVQWGHGTPRQTKAADAQALGILEESTLTTPTLYGSTILPAPGAPEPIGVSNQRMQAMGDAPLTGCVRGGRPVFSGRCVSVGDGPAYQAMGGCSCSGTCGCGTPLAVAAALNGIADNVPGRWVTLGVGAFLVWHFMKKRRR